MMRVLLIGDSLIKGTVGVNWVKALAKKRPGWELVNEGVNGETLSKIAARLEKKTAIDLAYDRIVFEAGANDLLIPWMAGKGFLYRLAYQQLIRKQYQPLNDPRDFEIRFRQAVEFIKERSAAPIILTTLGCLNEDPSFYLNPSRNIFNELIRDIAWDMGCRLADPGQLFDDYLEGREVKDYFLENFFNTSCLDQWRSAVAGGADSLSLSRGLHLTIDGLHLNSLGARFFREEIEKQLLRA